MKKKVTDETKRLLLLWDSNKTLREQATSARVSYSHTAHIAKLYGLKYKLDRRNYRNQGDGLPNRCTAVVAVGVNEYGLKHSRMFHSINEASSTLNIGRKAISNCLNGLSKSSGGFRWFYKKNLTEVCSFGK